MEKQIFFKNYSKSFTKTIPQKLSPIRTTVNLFWTKNSHPWGRRVFSGFQKQNKRKTKNSLCQIILHQYYQNHQNQKPFLVLLLLSLFWLFLLSSCSFFYALQEKLVKLIELLLNYPKKHNSKARLFSKCLFSQYIWTALIYFWISRVLFFRKNFFKISGALGALGLFDYFENFFCAGQLKILNRPKIK